MSTTTLAIETSCDETAVSVVRNDKIISNLVSSQIKLHAKWGGVVPNLAAREHLKNLPLLIEKTLEQTNLTPKNIDIVAVTQGPGLIPALLIGTNSAKTLSYLWNKPLLGIHHIEGHIYSNFIEAHSEIQFPVLTLVVSGGHTQLVYMKNHLSYEIIGQTLDDAAGEAFDKVARILGLPYPGGPQVSIQAQKYIEEKKKDNYGIELPRPMIQSPNLDFSFSGLKTAVLYTVNKNESEKEKPAFIQKISYEFQQAVIDVLITKTKKAIKKYSPKTLMIAGGVSANKELRKQLPELIAEKYPEIKFIAPNLDYAVDNAAMIGIAANFRWEHMNEKEKKDSLNNWQTLQAKADLKL